MDSTIQLLISHTFHPRNFALRDWADNDIATSIFTLLYERDWTPNGFYGHSASLPGSTTFYSNVTPCSGMHALLIICYLRKVVV